ncbi:MAG: hypothetical protein EOL95_07215 [Bacteroidia bacterium]|nr:hypothetical protein [Bacteroidia bacterium]
MKLKELKRGDLFKAKKDSNVLYRFIESFEDISAPEKTIYYLASRAYSNGNTGFFLTNGDKEVFI